MPGRGGSGGEGGTEKGKGEEGDYPKAALKCRKDKRNWSIYKTTTHLLIPHSKFFASLASASPKILPSGMGAFALIIALTSPKVEGPLTAFVG